MCVLAAGIAFVVVQQAEQTEPGGSGPIGGGPGVPSGPLPSLPSWAEKDSSTKRAAAYARNKKVVDDANAAGETYDLAMYGDSITERLASQYTAEWRAFTEGWKAAALGVSGNTVEELTWRLATGQEVFKRSPRVVVVLIGINDLHHSNRVNLDHLQFCLEYIRKAMPASKLVLLNILPDDRSDVTATNTQYKALAQKLGIVFSTCGSSLNPRDKNLFSDGTHPAPAGYRAVFQCLRPVVENLM